MSRPFQNVRRPNVSQQRRVYVRCRPYYRVDITVELPHHPEVFSGQSPAGVEYDRAAPPSGRQVQDLNGFFPQDDRRVAKRAPYPVVELQQARPELAAKTVGAVKLSADVARRDGLRMDTVQIQRLRKIEEPPEFGDLQRQFP